MASCDRSNGRMSNPACSHHREVRGLLQFIANSFILISRPISSLVTMGKVSIRLNRVPADYVNRREYITGRALREDRRKLRGTVAAKSTGSFEPVASILLS